MIIDAINKLNDELKGSKDEYKKLVVAHLVQRIKEDVGLGDDVVKDGKTLEGCIEYIRTEARKSAVNGVAVIEDSKVFEWAEDYYRSDVPVPKPTTKPTTKPEAKPKKPAPKKKSTKPTSIPSDSQVSLFDDEIIDETDDLWLF